MLVQTSLKKILSINLFLLLILLLSTSQAANIAGEWEYEGTAFTVRQDGSKAYGFINNTMVFDGSIAGETWHGRRRVTGVLNANGRCPEGEENVWVPFELTLSDGGIKMIGRYRNTRYSWSQSGAINCWVSGYEWSDMTIYSLTPLPMPAQLIENKNHSNTRDSTDLVTPPKDIHAERESAHSPGGRTCNQCGNALLSSLAAKVEILGLDEVRHFLLSARTKYAECIQDIPQGCEHTSVYWKDKYALDTCYINFPQGGEPIRSCILEILYK